MYRRLRLKILRPRGGGRIRRGGGRITEEEKERLRATAYAALGIRAGVQQENRCEQVSNGKKRTGAARRKKRRGKGQETTVVSSGVGREPTSPASDMEGATVLEEDVATVTDEEGGWGNMAPSMP